MDRLGRVAYYAFVKVDQSEGQDDNNQKGKAKDVSRGVPAFGTFASCFKASMELGGYIRQLQQSPLRDELNLKVHGIGIVHGLAVLDGKLYEASVRTRDDIDIVEVHWLPYIFNNASSQYGQARSFLVDVVTLQYLPTYLDRYVRWLDERATFALGDHRLGDLRYRDTSLSARGCRRACVRRG